MRQYRGKRKDNGEWVYGSFLGGRLCHIMSHKTVKKTDSTSMFAGKEVLPVIPESVGQSTGLKDKNGKEIYDGDVLTHNVPETLPGGKLNLNKHITQEMTVKWNDTLCGWNLIKTTHPSYIVIGTIHDNPELL